jgi:outer membrane protein TolC
MATLQKNVWVAVLLLAGIGGSSASGRADPPPVDADVLTVEKAVAWTLQYSPELAVARKQRGIAEANVVIAHTYPFNPYLQSSTLGAGGPSSADIRNRVFLANSIRLELELRGQKTIRTTIAAAALSRTELEVAALELAGSIRAMRAFNTFVYRQEKMGLLDDTIKLQEQTVQKVKALAEQNKLRPADHLVAAADLLDARGARGPSRALLVASWNDLSRIMGIDKSASTYDGRLDAGGPKDDADELTRVALQTRPDLLALQQAVVEADERVRLEVANRFGNPAIGPMMEYNETRVHFIGATLAYALPVLNVKRGEILLRQAERERVVEDRRRVEIQTALDVRAALDRIREARKWVGYFGSESLPALQKTMESFEKLFAAGEPGVDVGRLLDARRRLLRSRDSYLDALWELSQARVDLAAAVGDLNLALTAPAPPAVAQVVTAAAVAPPAPPAATTSPAILPRPLFLPPVPRLD